MILVKFLLPRFLVLEVVLFFHLLHYGQCEKPEETDNCSLALSKSLERFLPLLYRSDGEEFYFPNGTSNHQYISMASEDTISASCPGSILKTGQQNATFKCLGGLKFLCEKSQCTLSEVLSDLACKKSIVETVQKSENSSCGFANGPAHLVEVGWPSFKSPSKVLTQYKVCHNEAAAHTLYTSHIVHGQAATLKMFKSKAKRNFKEGKFFFQSVSAARAYKLKTQDSTFKNLLGESSARKYFSSAFFLSKGHLVPEGDFAYPEWQEATHYFFNIVPQWQSFNNGNWKVVESLVRKYSEVRKKNLVVHTGTYGQLKLPDENGNLVPLSLHPEDNLIPVPELFWKIIFDKEENKAVVFLGVNNPHTTLSRIKDEGLILCPDERSTLCSDLNWKIKTRNSVFKGYLYCCPYKAVKSKIDWLPFLKDPSLLSFSNSY